MTNEQAIRILEEFKVIDDWTIVHLPPMEDAVDKAIEALRSEVLCALADRTCPFQGKEFVWCLTCQHISEEDRNLIKKVVQEPKTGEWILTPMLPDDCRYKCSICKCHHRERYDYCPSCGAKMVDCGKCKHWESDTGYCYEIADSDSHECNFEQI